MAYRSKRAGSYRKRAFGGARRRKSNGTRSGSGKRFGASRGRAQTLRIVIEQPAPNSVSRDLVGMVSAAEPRKARF